MPTVTRTWTFTADLQSWVATSGGTGNTCSRSTTGGNNDAGCLSNASSGKNRTGSGRFDLVGTWEALFGIPAGSTVTNILVSGDGYYGKCTTYTTGAASTDGPLELRNSDGSVLILTLVSGRSYSATDASYVSRTPGSLNQTVPTSPTNYQPSNTTVSIRLAAAVNTGSSSSANNTLLQDDIKVTITYTLPTLTTTLSVTESPDTISASVGVVVSTALSVSEAADIATASVGVLDALTVGTTEAEDTFSASVDLVGALSAALSATEPADIASASINVAWAALSSDLSVTESPDAVAATVGLSWVGLTVSLGVSESADVVTALAGSTVSLGLNATEALDAFSGSVQIQGGIAGALGAIEITDGFSGTASVALALAMTAGEVPDDLRCESIFCASRRVRLGPYVMQYLRERCAPRFGQS